MRAAWRKYNEGHREERSEGNREYVQRPVVRAHIREMKKVRKARLPEGPVTVVVPGAFKLVRPRSPLEQGEVRPPKVFANQTTGACFTHRSNVS